MRTSFLLTIHTYIRKHSKEVNYLHICTCTKDKFHLKMQSIIMTQFLFLSGVKLRLSHQWSVNSFSKFCSKCLWKCETIRYYTWKLAYIRPQHQWKTFGGLCLGQGVFRDFSVLVTVIWSRTLQSLCLGIDMSFTAASYSYPCLGVIMGVAASLYPSFPNCMVSTDGVAKFLSDSSTMKKFQTLSLFPLLVEEKMSYPQH